MTVFRLILYFPYSFGILLTFKNVNELYWLKITNTPEDDMSKKGFL